MESYKNHPPKATIFSKIYAEYFRRCLLYAQSYLQDPCLAEDVASEAMMRLWENWDDSYSTVQRKAFLLTIIRNRCLDHLRRIQTTMKTQEDLTAISHREHSFRISLLESTVPQELFVSDIQEIVNKTLKQLPEQTRLIFQLSRIENKTASEIANDLGISIKTVEYHMSKSLSVLRKNLKDYLPVIMFLYF
jgi:RNA polymerase sigma-70 factor (ECF subfamily)